MISLPLALLVEAQAAGAAPASRLIDRIACTCPAWDAAVVPLATLIAKTRNDFGVIVFPGGNHTLQRDRAERDRQAVGFFRSHLVE